MSTDIAKVSKFLSLVLRHKPEEIGLTLDENGWADVDELVRLANARGHGLTWEVLERVVAENDKKRFAFSDDGLIVLVVTPHYKVVDYVQAILRLEEVSSFG